MRVLVAVHRTIGEAQLARAIELDAELVLLHVLPRAGAAREAAARAYLDTLVAQLATRGVHAIAAVRAGRLAETILAEARALEVDAILLGVTRGLRRVLGGASATIAQRAHCRVLLVDRADHAKPTPLLSFGEAAERAGPFARRLPRLETVEVAHIVGSVGRSSELDVNFRPPRRARRKHDDERLERIRVALERGHILPPIEVYRLGAGLYVLDGHHRVAAALLNGQPEIDAYVVEHVPTGHLARHKTDQSRSIGFTQPPGAIAAA
jgi:nucleotide-binding universal stress UspA family protein